MKIMMMHVLAYLPDPERGGAPKANRSLLEGLARRGHECRVVAPFFDHATQYRGGHYEEELRARGIRIEEDRARVRHEGVDLQLHRARPWQLYAFFDEQMRAFQPDWILVPSEIHSYMGLEVALEACPGRVVYLSQTTMCLPFGPASANPDGRASWFLGQARGILTISEYLRDYIARHGDLASTVAPLPVYGSGPFPDLGSFDDGLVTMVNPSAVKGFKIFEGLARALPEVQFGAVPLWGTTASERESLAALPNVELLKASGNIEDILARTRMLLVPSVWEEAFGYICIDAMLRGVPVISSDVGGLPEAKLGVDYILPVRPIDGYGVWDRVWQTPNPRVPEQDLGPWIDAVRLLLSDRDRYEVLSVESREKAHAFLERADAAHIEAYLESLS